MIPARIAPTFQFQADRNALATAIREAIAGRVKALQGDVAIDVVAGGKRGAEWNALIGRVQAALGRNPFYLSSDQKAALKEELRRAVARGATEADFKKAGEMLVRFVRSNIESQRNPSGRPFTPVTDAYAERKRARGQGSTILVATGDLKNGLAARITRVGGTSRSR